MGQRESFYTYITKRLGTRLHLIVLHMLAVLMLHFSNYTEFDCLFRYGLPVDLVSVPDSHTLKGGGGVWYSCLHSNLQSVEFLWHESDWLIAM